MSLFFSQSSAGEVMETQAGMWGQITVVPVSVAGTAKVSQNQCQKSKRERCSVTSPLLVSLIPAL